MLRIVHNGTFQVDIKQTADGRGRYICSSLCAGKLDNIKILCRAFRQKFERTDTQDLLDTLAVHGWKD